MKDGLARKIMKKVAGLRPEMYFYIKLNDKEEGKKLIVQKVYYKTSSWAQRLEKLFRCK